ncbi:MurR/RpiR family transcriptional regulator [Saccharospirillum salsuginis]|nr:MurR/RpiR family transcriptional regulator [Saccharospirillum salsuginis]
MPPMPEPSNANSGTQTAEPLPPKNLAALQRVRAAIEDKRMTLALGRRSLRVLAELLDNPRQAAMSSITELAGELGVSPATLSRLARQLGFEGFKAFQQVFRRESSGQSRYYSQQARQLSGKEYHTRQRIERMQSTLDQLVSWNDEALLNEVARQLYRSRRVKIYARRQSTSLASFLGYCLAMLRPRVTVLGTGELGASHAAALLEPNDLTVFIGFHPYSPSTVKVARVAKEKACRMIAITDSHTSPIAALAETVVRVPVDTGFYSNSLVAATALIELLLDKAAYLAGDAGIAALEEREQLIVKMQDEY